MKWYEKHGWTGSHPFETVFSWHGHGVLLYPPTEDSGWRYRIYVHNYAYANMYLEMVLALMGQGIPFEAPRLEEVLDYFAGEAYLSVNGYDELNFDHIPCREYRQKYFKHIEWKPLEILKFRSSGSYPV